MGMELNVYILCIYYKSNQIKKNVNIMEKYVYNTYEK